MRFWPNWLLFHKKAQIKKPLKQSDEIDDSCNFRNKNTCPLEGNFSIRNIVYFCKFRNVVAENKLLKNRLPHTKGEGKTYPLSDQGG